MQPTLTDRDRDIVQSWIRAEGLGEHLTDVEPLTGGTQNIVVRLHIDGRPVVLRRPPLPTRASHPSPTLLPHWKARWMPIMLMEHMIQVI